MKEELAEGGKARTDTLCRGSRGERVTYKCIPTTRPSIFQKGLLPSSYHIAFQGPIPSGFLPPEEGHVLNIRDQNTFLRPRSKNSYRAILDYRIWVG